MTDLADDLILEGAPAGFGLPAGCHALTVTEVQHYTDRLFRFRVTRPASFRFRSGEFVMIGLLNLRIEPSFTNSINSLINRFARSTFPSFKLQYIIIPYPKAGYSRTDFLQHRMVVQ